MTTFRTLALAATFLSAAPQLAGANPVLGVWQTEPDGAEYAHIELVDCAAGQVCGRIVNTFDAQGETPSAEIGLVIVRGMVDGGGGAYEGEVWDPKRDRTFLARMQLEGDDLAFNGCVLGGLICRQQTWTRVN